MSDHLTDCPLAIIGSGAMAQAYAKSLAAQGRQFCVVGRGAESAAKFRAATGIDVITGGVERWLDGCGVAPPEAIIAATPALLPDVTIALLEAGTQRVLIEKPGAMDRSGLARIERTLAATTAEAYIAYNRRFYASTLAAERIVREDGGLTSLQFEFTEWTHRIDPTTRPKIELEGWLHGNSGHVIDLAFHLGGRPRDWHCWAGGHLDWHPHGAIFCGAGTTDRGALFSYHANWQAPGRWSVELLTRKHRLHLKPLEALGVQEIRSLEVKPFPIDDRLDREFKPGIYRQTQAFLDGTEAQRLQPFARQVEFWDHVLDPIANGSPMRHAA